VWSGDAEWQRGLKSNPDVDGRVHPQDVGKCRTSGLNTKYPTYPNIIAGQARNDGGGDVFSCGGCYIAGRSPQ
jgi:hypothetical protein